MPQKSVRLFIYLPVGGSFAFGAGEPAGHPAPGSVFPALSPIPLRERAWPSRSPAVYQAPLNTAGDLSPPRPGTCGAAAAIPLAAGLARPAPACERRLVPPLAWHELGSARLGWRRAIAGWPELSFAKSRRTEAARFNSSVRLRRLVSARPYAPALCQVSPAGLVKLRRDSATC